MAIVITNDIVEDANDYFLTRLNSDGWTGSDDQTRKSALVTAANLLNAMEWAGRAVSTLSAFPRYLPNSSTPVTPVKILWALYEQAIHLMNNPGLLLEEESVETLVVGPIQLQKLSSVDLIPKIVRRYISDYTASNGNVGGGPIWWRAN